MSNTEIRWQQRFNNYKRAVKQLDAAVQLAATRDLTEFQQFSDRMQALSKHE